MKFRDVDEVVPVVQVLCPIGLTLALYEDAPLTGCQLPVAEVDAMLETERPEGTPQVTEAGAIFTQ